MRSSLYDAESREAFHSIEVHIIVEIESVVKVKAQILPNGFRGDNRAPYQ